MTDQGLPVLLTVEEAGEVLRIGRTKAYAMAREWRQTEGQSGLPVIDLGHVLRVPLRALEEMLGSELSEVPNLHRSDSDSDSQPEASSEPPPMPVNASTDTPPVDQPQTTFRNRRHRKPMADQLDLFDPEPTAS